MPQATGLRATLSDSFWTYEASESASYVQNASLRVARIPSLDQGVPNKPDASGMTPVAQWHARTWTRARDANRASSGPHFWQLPSV